MITVYDSGERFEKKEHRFFDKYGSRKCVNYILQPIFDQNSEVKFLMTLGYDVSDEVNFKNELIKSEFRFKILMDFIPQIVWTINNKDNSTYFNQSWFENFGNSNQLNSIDDFIQLIYPDCKKVFIERWRNANTTNDFFEVELKLKCVQNDFKWFLISALPVFDLDKNIDMWIFTCTNINYLKLFQNRKIDMIDMLSNELINPLTSLRLYSTFIKFNLSKDTESKSLDLIFKMDNQILQLSNLIGELMSIIKLDNETLT